MNRIKERIEIIMESDIIPRVLTFIALVIGFINLLIFMYLMPHI